MVILSVYTIKKIIVTLHLLPILFVTLIQLNFWLRYTLPYFFSSEVVYQLFSTCH